MSNTNQDLLLKIYEELKETKEQVKQIPEIKYEMLEMKEQMQKIPMIESEISKINTQLEDIQQKEMPEIKGEISKINTQLEDIQRKEMPEIKQELSSISGSVARIEVEHGEKLVALFDAFKVNTEKIEEQNKKITKYENILEKHDHQIYIFNSKIQNEKAKNA